MTDCEREAASMASIDSNTILTFSATAAGDGSGGCIFDYDSSLSIQRKSDTSLVRLIAMMAWMLTTRRSIEEVGRFQVARLGKRMVCFAEEQNAMEVYIDARIRGWIFSASNTNRPGTRLGEESGTSGARGIISLQASLYKFWYWVGGPI
jgi:hypothetical protein